MIIPEERKVKLKDPVSKSDSEKNDYQWIKIFLISPILSNAKWKLEPKKEGEINNP